MTDINKHDNSTTGFTQTIPLHYNVPTHAMPLSAFIETAISTKSIIDELNNSFFDGELEYEVLIATPEPGGVVQKILISTAVAAFYVTQPIATEYVQARIEAASGKTVEEMAHEHQLGHEISSKEGLELLMGATKDVLQKKPDELKSLGIGIEKCPEVYRHRNRFFNSCYSNPIISGLGFSEEHSFPLNRGDFVTQIVNLPKLKENEGAEEIEWKTEIRNLVVTSPNWRHREKEKRQWRAEDEQGKEIYFTVEDGAFWKLLEVEHLEPRYIDRIKVQIATSDNDKNRVLKVLEYNGKPVSEPLTDEQLDAVLGKHSLVERTQSDLFDSVQNSPKWTRPSIITDSDAEKLGYTREEALSDYSRSEMTSEDDKNDNPLKISH